MTGLSPWRRLLALGLAFAAVSVFVSVCGDDSGSSSSSGDSSASTVASGEEDETESAGDPEDVIVSDSEVTAGLTKSIEDMETLADGVEAGTATEAQFEAIHEDWESYEGTVKQNDVDAYLGLEDALAAMQGAITDGDAEAAQDASDAFGSEATFYLSEHP